jgi:pyrroline-5-carboxylate reductase
LSNPTIAFIGGGNMATSLIGGLIANGFDPARIRASDPLADGRARLEREFAIATFADNTAACAAADVIVLAVKPQILKTVAQGIAASLAHNPVVVSIAAGIAVNALQAWLGENTAIVRCMPNTPALVHLGASGLYATASVSAEQKTLVEQLFSAVGIAAWLDNEVDIDAVTALSGSGPAYFFLLMEAMENAGVALGLDAQTARQLTLQTALGAATMAANSDVDSAELRRRVTSPGGTTESAIVNFNKGGFSDLVHSAMAAASQRAAEMAKEFSQ